MKYLKPRSTTHVFSMGSYDYAAHIGYHRNKGHVESIYLEKLGNGKTVSIFCREIPGLAQLNNPVNGPFYHLQDILEYVENYIIEQRLSGESTLEEN